MRHEDIWSKEQVEYVQENYGRLPMNEISEKIGKKPGSIRAKMSRLGTEPVTAIREWSKHSLFISLFTDASTDCDFKFVFRTGRFVCVGDTKFEEIWIRDSIDCFEHVKSSQIERYKLLGYQSFIKEEISAYTIEGMFGLVNEETNPYELTCMFESSQWETNRTVVENE